MTAMTNDLRSPCMDAIESVLDRCEHYSNYFGRIEPVTPHDMWRRYLFAYTTVNLSWQSSIKLYAGLDRLEWPASEEDIRNAFIAAKSGFQNTRPRFIADFAARYFKGINFLKFQHKPGRDWVEFRQALDNEILGLGMIKISFTMELAYPQETRIVCLDRHMLARIFHTDPTSNVAGGQYLHYEHLWVQTCRDYGAAPGIARLAYWDLMQGRDSPDYWAHVFKRKEE